MKHYIGPLLLQIVLIALNAIFASAEAAFLASNSNKIEKLVEEGNKKAKRFQRLTKDSSKFLSTIQVAITLAGFLGSAFAAEAFAPDLCVWFNRLPWVANTLGIQIPETVFVVVITFILSFFSIVLGELVPKKVAMKHAEGVSLALCGFIKFMSVIFAPFVWILTKTSNGVLRLCGINPKDEEEVASEEEIRMILDTSSEKGEIDSMENEMIQNIFEFDDILISEVCTHRRDVDMLYMEDSLDVWREKIVKSRHGLYPICGEDADDIVGVLNIRKFFRNDCKTVDEAIAKASEKPYFVPENMTADVLFTNMKETRNYFAIVVDEYGGTSGVITIHDLLELLVGDMGDKDEVKVEEIVCVNEESDEWRILGSASLEKVAQELKISFETEDCDTFGGYIFGLLGEIPDDGSRLELETEQLVIKVESVADHRIESTLVTVKERPVDEDSEAESEDGDDEDKKKRKLKDGEDEETALDEDTGKKAKKVKVREVDDSEDESADTAQDEAEAALSAE